MWKWSHFTTLENASERYNLSLDLLLLMFSLPLQTIHFLTIDSISLLMTIDNLPINFVTAQKDRTKTNGNSLSVFIEGRNVIVKSLGVKWANDKFFRVKRMNQKKICIYLGIGSASNSPVLNHVTHITK